MIRLKQSLKQDLKNDHKPLAKNSLKRIKVLESVLEKRMDSMHLLQDILLKLNAAESDAKVVIAFIKNRYYKHMNLDHSL
jgi:hypothetical protein